MGSRCAAAGKGIGQNRREGAPPFLIFKFTMAIPPPIRAITYHRLQVETQVLAAILRNFGVAQGDRVVLYMPMVPEAVIAMSDMKRRRVRHAARSSTALARMLKLINKRLCGRFPLVVKAIRAFSDTREPRFSYAPGPLS
jgi:hypothetical protein